MTTDGVSHYVDINGFRLHYVERGDPKAPVVLCLHGTGDNCRTWDHFNEAAAGRFRTIALDQRGHGKSDRAARGAYTCMDYVGDLAKFIDKLYVEKLVLLGHSMGALHCARYCAMMPEKPLGFVHVDIEARPPAWNKKYLCGLYQTLPHCYRSMEDFVEELRTNSPYASDEMLFRLASFALEERSDGNLYRTCDREVYGRFDVYDERDSLSRVTCPALVIRGAESRVLRREVAEQMASTLPKGSFAEIPAANHPVHLDNPDAFARVVLDFLQTLELMDR